MLRHPQSATGGPLTVEKEEAPVASTSASTNKGTFRFWHEERRFKGSGERCIVQRALFESGGVRIGGYPKSAPIPGPLGWQRPGDWDFLWAPARLALKAVPHLKPGQLVSACPGLMSITKKRRLPATLKEALGEALAWDIVPRSFSLPEELPQLAAYTSRAATTAAPSWSAPSAATAAAATAAAAPSGAASSAAAGDGDGEGQAVASAGAVGTSSRCNGSDLLSNASTVGSEAAVAGAPRGVAGVEMAAAGSASSSAANGVGAREEAPRAQELWILKTAQHLGKGLKLVPLEAVALEAGRPRRRPSQKPYVLAQRYVDRPLLVGGRKFGIRVWVAVTGFNPLRAYLHANGLVLFSTHGYDSSSWRTEAGDVALGHITNYAQNMGGTVWNLKQLEEHMGPEAYGKMWGLVRRNSALVIAAALKHIKTDHELFKVPSGMTCEVVGLDYLIDTDLHPWLLEVNGTPSLQVEHEDPKVEQLIHDQKYGMVQDLMSLLGLRDRFKPRYAALRATAKAKQQAVAAAAVATASAGGSLAAAVASATAAAAAASKPNAALTRRLREQLQPSSDGAVMSRVVHELTFRGGFEPLMPLMPLEPQPGLNVPWEPRDFELRRAMAAGEAGMGALGLVTTGSVLGGLVGNGWGAVEGRPVGGELGIAEEEDDEDKDADSEGEEDGDE